MLVAESTDDRPGPSELRGRKTSLWLVYNMGIAPCISNSSYQEASHAGKANFGESQKRQEKRKVH
jgi:hypothetical protein